MATVLSKQQWEEILTNEKLTNDFDLAIFQTLYSCEKHKAYASQIGRLLGHNGKVPHAPLNLEIGRYAKRIAKIYPINFTKRNEKKYKYWDLFFIGYVEGAYFVWQLKPELADALHDSGLTGETFFAEELSITESFSEGLKKTVTVNTYERNPAARKLCIAHWKSVCCVCGFDFKSNYGEIGEGFIHVHHLTPIAKIGQSYKIDPINELKPVCPNCHSMLHIVNPPLTIEQLKDIIRNQRESSPGCKA